MILNETKNILIIEARIEINSNNRFLKSAQFFLLFQNLNCIVWKLKKN